MFSCVLHFVLHHDFAKNKTYKKIHKNLKPNKWNQSLQHGKKKKNHFHLFKGCSIDYICQAQVFKPVVIVIIIKKNYTLTGHFIRTPFCLQNCLNSSWHRFNKVLETFLTDFGPYWHDSMTMNSLSCSSNQSEMIWALWYGALSCWK